MKCKLPMSGVEEWTESQHYTTVIGLWRDTCLIIIVTRSVWGGYISWGKDRWLQRLKNKNWSRSWFRITSGGQIRKDTNSTHLSTWHQHLQSGDSYALLDQSENTGAVLTHLLDNIHRLAKWFHFPVQMVEHEWWLQWLIQNQAFYKPHWHLANSKNHHKWCPNPGHCSWLPHDLLSCCGDWNHSDVFVRLMLHYLTNMYYTYMYIIATTFYRQDSMQTSCLIDSRLHMTLASS